MKQFHSLLEAAEYAATRSISWSFATADEKYNTESLLGIAGVSDNENPADEDSFYVVSNAGSIGFCQDGEEIDWLFLSDSGSDENLPLEFQATGQNNFCSKCGAPTSPNARFCGNCGERL